MYWLGRGRHNGYRQRPKWIIYLNILINMNSEPSAGLVDVNFSVDIMGIRFNNNRSKLDESLSLARSYKETNRNSNNSEGNFINTKKTKMTLKMKWNLNCKLTRKSATRKKTWITKTEVLKKRWQSKSNYKPHLRCTIWCIYLLWTQTKHTQATIRRQWERKIMQSL